MDDLEKFTQACIEALHFTDEAPAGAYPEEGCFPAGTELHPDTEEDLRADCRSFWRRFGAFVLAAGADPEQAGHDFWLTRNEHGTGFWDRPEIYAPYTNMLAKGAECYGEFETYLGYDGFVHA